MTPQIKKLKKNCFKTMRKIASMKKYSFSNQFKILIHALVLSSLDYCNFLYYGINSSNTRQLQTIQNRACIIIYGLKKKFAVNKHLKELHWLRVQERIEFKVILLTFKCLNDLVPSYLTELLRYNNISGSRAPTLKQLLCNSTFGDRAFIFYAPRL